MNPNSFENTQTAFELKTNSQLKRAYWLFKMLSYPNLVKFGSGLAKLSLRLNLPVTQLIRSSVFDHFCGGIDEADCLPVIKNMYTKNVSSVLDYSVEGKYSENQFDDAAKKILDIIDFGDSEPALPIVVFKPTAFGRFFLFQKLTEKKTLTIDEQNEWQRIVKRFDKVCNYAKQKGVFILIDAEESWMQDAADDLVELMMKTYNTSSVIIYNTIQAYRWDRLDYLKQLHARSKAEGFKLGVKLVRGAYMEKERERALQLNYKSPICKDKTTTDVNFDTTMRYIFEHINDIAIFVGSHNEASNYLATEIMESLKIPKSSHLVWFGQLFGMSDHISYNLADQGYNVAKYLPFGPVKEVIPYLIRRAQENTSVEGQTTRELSLITKEVKRRKI